MLEKIMETVSVVIGGALGVFIGMLVGGGIAFVFWSYWGWFVAPLGLPAIGFFHAWGLVIMSGLVVPLPQITGESEIQIAHGRRQIVSIALAWPFGLFLHILT